LAPIPARNCAGVCWPKLLCGRWLLKFVLVRPQHDLGFCERRKVVLR